LAEQPELGASLLQLFLIGQPTLLLDPIYIAYHSRKGFLELPQLRDATGQDGVSAKGSYSLRILTSRRHQLAVLPAVLCSMAKQCLQHGSQGASIPPLDAETLSAFSTVLPAQPVRIAVFLPRTMFYLIVELGQGFKLPCDLARGLSSLTQPNQ